MTRTEFDATLTADRTIRIPDDIPFEEGAAVRVVMLPPEPKRPERTGPPTDEEIDEMIANINATAEKLRAGIDVLDKNGRSLKRFTPLYSLPKDWKFNREEIYERG